MQIAPEIEAGLAHITEVAAALGLLPEEIQPYGRFAAKIELPALDRLRDRPDGKLVCVTALTPTKAGEGKTTTAISLVDALGRLGERPILCLREPSLGPVFGIKGGGTGGGRKGARAEGYRSHFTGDIHAIGAANNLLAAMASVRSPARTPSAWILRASPAAPSDMDYWAPRQVVVGLGGRANGCARETGFDITAASEVMALPPSRATTPTSAAASARSRSARDSMASRSRPSSSRGR